jgi:hypothetical protein
MTLQPDQIVSPREPHPAGELFILTRTASPDRLIEGHPFPGGPFGERVYLFSPEDLISVPALSIWQPWAWLIVRGYKDVENRGWAPKTPPPWLLIHASKRFRPGEIVEIFEDIKAADLAQGARVTLNDLKAQLGGIVGVARLTGCVQGSRSPWADDTPGTWHWELADARPLPFHPCRGQQGLFYPAYNLGLLREATHA